MGGENFCLEGPAGGDGMWGVMALCGGCDTRMGGELASMYEISICHALYSYTYIQSYFLIICCEICKTSSYICIEVNDKHRDWQDAKYGVFGLYHNSHIRCDVTPTWRIYKKCQIVRRILTALYS